MINKYITEYTKQTLKTVISKTSLFLFHNDIHFLPWDLEFKSTYTIR